MKPTDLVTGKPQVEVAPSFVASSRADPPITAEEAATAQVSICPWHDGLVRLTGDKPGRVFYCPTGEMHWRYQSANRYQSLRYPKRS
jgi:hypothetical protein